MDTNTNRFRMAKQVSDQTRRITYFGRITEINDEFIELQDVFYLQFKNGITSFAEAKSVDDIALIKLDCEIHGPEDPMMINRLAVLYRESLRSDVRVAMVSNNRKTANPNGQDCTTTAANGRSRYGTYYKRNGIDCSDMRNRARIL